LLFFQNSNLRLSFVMIDAVDGVVVTKFARWSVRGREKVVWKVVIDGLGVDSSSIM
jgi:hypothetical protein